MASKVVLNGVDHPLNELEKIAKESGLEMSSVEFAKLMDDSDPLKELRQEFHYPKMGEIHDSEFDTFILGFVLNLFIYSYIRLQCI